MPKFVPISTFWGFPVSHACLLWVALIFPDNRSTRLLPKGPFELLKRTTLPKLGVLSSKLVHYHDRIFVSFKPISQGLCIRKLLVFDHFTQKSSNLWKHETMTEKVVELPTESRWWWLEFSCWESFSYPITETVQVKSVLGVSSPFEVSSCSMQIRAGSLFCIGLFWSWTAPPGHALTGIRNFREVWAQAAFFWLKGSSFQIYSSILKALLPV